MPPSGWVMGRTIRTLALLACYFYFLYPTLCDFVLLKKLSKYPSRMTPPPPPMRLGPGQDIKRPRGTYNLSYAHSRDFSIAGLFFLVFVLYTLCFCSVKKLININLESHQGLIGHNFSPLHLRDVSIAVLFFLVRGPYPILSENIYLCFCPDKK